MGLDSVEMVIAVEDRFGITIPDDQAYNCRTVGDLNNLVLMLLAGKMPGRCVTQRVFYRLRKSIPFAQRNGLHPTGSLKELIADENAQKDYAEIEDNLGLRLPYLVDKYFFDWRLALLRCLFLFLAYFIFVAFNTAFNDLDPFVASVIGIALFSASVLIPLASLPESPKVVPGQTIRQFVEQIVALNYDILAPEEQDDESVFNQLRELIVYTLGVKPAEVIPSARFQQDLGVD